MQLDPWELYEQTIDYPDDRRKAALRDALAVLSGSPQPEPDRAELRAVIECELAGLGEMSLAQAQFSVGRATALGRAGWPNLHLAELAFKCGVDSLVTSSAQAVPANFFEGQDLRWRHARLFELQAVVQQRLGNDAAVGQLIEDLVAIYRTTDWPGDLMTPSDLTEELLAGGLKEQRLLRRLTASMSLEDWFPNSAARIRRFLEQ